MKQLARETIRDLRKQRNMTQEQVAEMVDCHACTISRIETGKCIPYLKNYEKIFWSLGGYGIDYDVINKSSGYLQEQMGKRVLESLENRDFEETRHWLSELREFIDMNNKYDYQLLYTLELILTKVEGKYVDNLSGVFSDLLMLTRSREDFEKAAELICLTPVEMLILNNIAVCYIEEGDAPKAIQILNLLIRNCDRVMDIPFLDKTRAVLYNNLGLSYLSNNQPNMAMYFVNKGLDCILKKGGVNLLFEMLLLKTKVYEVCGNHEDAMVLKHRLKGSYYLLCESVINCPVFEEFEPLSGGICIL